MSKKEIVSVEQAQVISLSERDSNKLCADCKEHKNTRWTSVIIGVFICIECSGHHRGIGTDFSRVRSVNLDKWSPEQRDKMVAWGNVKANKYWEATMKPGEMERYRDKGAMKDFIKKKYVEKKWVLDPKVKPDPAMYGEAGDDVPLNVVQEQLKAKKRGSSSRITSLPGQQLPPPPKPKPPIDLIDDDSASSTQPFPPPPKTNPSMDFLNDPPAPPVRPSTTDTPGTRTQPSKVPAAPKPAKASDSLLNLDFFGAPPPSTNGRPSSAASTPSGSMAPSRKALTDNIMALYTKPSPKPQQPLQHERQSSTGAMQSPPALQQPGLGGLGDAFSGLNFNPPTSPPAAPSPNTQQPKPDPFARINNSASLPSSTAPPKVTSPLSNGRFFDPAPKPTPKPSVAPKLPPQMPISKADPLLFDDFGGFTTASNSTPAAPKASTASASNDLFDFSEPSGPAQVPLPSASAPQKSSAPISSPSISSAFNLSSQPPPSQPTAKAAAPPPTTTATSSAFSNIDAWGSSDAWATPEPAPSTTTAPQPKLAAPPKAPSIPMSTDFSAWGGTSASSNTQPSTFTNTFGSTSHAAPKVAPDEDFGGWSSAAPAAPAAANPPPSQQSKPAGGGSGFGGSDDLFSNVWE